MVRLKGQVGRTTALVTATGVTLWLTALVTAGSAAGIGSAHGARTAAATGCKPGSGEVVTLRLGAPRQVARADVGDTIKVIARVPGGAVDSTPHSDHKRAVCRISVRRVSKSEVIAMFRAQRAREEKIRFQASGETSSKGCPPRSHGCPRPDLLFGYVKISSSARSG